MKKAIKKFILLEGSIIILLVLSMSVFALNTNSGNDSSDKESSSLLVDNNAAYADYNNSIQPKCGEGEGEAEKKKSEKKKSEKKKETKAEKKAEKKESESKCGEGKCG